MIKRQQRWIALFVALTFMWLLQMSTMPVAATGTTEQARFTSSEQGPDFVEAVGHKVPPAPKKSILPLVLIGVGVVAVAAVLFLVVLKTSYDITGSWEFVLNRELESRQFTVIFTGTKASGNFQFPGFPDNYGPYTVDGKNVTMTMTHFPDEQFSGQFTGKDSMTGTLSDEGDIWTWTATRNATTAAAEPTPAAQTMLYIN